MIIAVLETLGLVAAVAAFVLTRGSPRLPGMLRTAALGLIGLLALGHLANVLETQDMVWADTIADQLSILTPLLWGLFLLENGRGYLSERLRASDEQLRFFLDAVPTSVAWLDADTQLLGFSQAWAQVLPESKTGARLETVLPASLPELERAVRQCLAGEADRAQSQPEETIRAADGTERHFCWSICRWRHPDRKAPGALLLLQEVTAAHEAEARRQASADELARNQRLAHVGQIAAGAAHDFNNFLQVIEAAVFELDTDARQGEVMRNVRGALDNARELTRSMLRVGAEPAKAGETVDLVALVREMTRPLGYALGRRHRLEVTFPQVTQLAVKGRGARLQQALLNLAINARDASPNGGAIEIILAAEGNEAVVRVRDFGVGLSASDRQRLFQPFFTTKGANGSGLGLNVVKAVVSEHAGKIEVDSVAGQGATFTLRLPLLSAA
jgi:signal transduction histidine kinase